MHRAAIFVCAGLVCLAGVALAACSESQQRDSSARWREVRESSAPAEAARANTTTARAAAPAAAPHTTRQPKLPGPHVAAPPTEAAHPAGAPAAKSPPATRKTAAAHTRKPEQPAVTTPAQKPAASPARPQQPARPRVRPLARPAVPAPAAVPSVPLPAVAPAMLLGFQDDGAFRWSDDRAQHLDQAATAGGTIIRTTLNWSQVAARRPADASNPFDPAYRFDNTDELIRNAQQRGIQVLLTIWGTPTWANGDAGHNHAPTRAADLRDFARAVAERYSGVHAGYPFVGYYTVWNEPNLEQFLAPQYDAAGRAVAPGIYARMYRAAYAGIKAGNPSALVAAGETSPRGRDVPTTARVQQSESPGRFAQLLSRERPRIRFDAWAHHPYPTAPNLPPTQLARWPNVTLRGLPRLEAALRTWFDRPDVPIWVTEYAYQTNPPYRFGVSPARQAAYLTQAMRTLSADSWVRMAVWFTFRDSAGNPWKSGLLATDGKRKPAFAAFVAAEQALVRRNDAVAASSRSRVQTITLPAQTVTYYSGPGAAVGLQYRVLEDGVAVAHGATAAELRRDGTVVLRLSFRPHRGVRYTVTVTGSDVHGNKLAATRTLIALD